MPASRSQPRAKKSSSERRIQQYRMSADQGNRRGIDNLDAFKEVLEDRGSGFWEAANSQSGVGPILPRQSSLTGFCFASQSVGLFTCRPKLVVRQAAISRPLATTARNCTGTLGLNVKSVGTSARTRQLAMVASPGGPTIFGTLPYLADGKYRCSQ